MKTLQPLVSNKVLATESPAEFEKELNALLRSGWQVGNIQTAMNYDQMQHTHKFAFLAVFTKEGLQ